jgi:Na+(H+)/acetate symporter ActP
LPFTAAVIAVSLIAVPVARAASPADFVASCVVSLVFSIAVSSFWPAVVGGSWRLHQASAIAASRTPPRNLWWVRGDWYMALFLMML